MNLAEESGENKEENSNVSAGMLTRHEEAEDGGSMILVPFHHPKALVSLLFDKGQVIFHCYWRRRGMCSITCDQVCLR